MRKTALEVASASISSDPNQIQSGQNVTPTILLNEGWKIKASGVGNGKKFGEQCNKATQIWTKVEKTLTWNIASGQCFID